MRDRALRIATRIHTARGLCWVAHAQGDSGSGRPFHKSELGARGETMSTEVAKIVGQPLQSRTREAYLHCKGCLGTSRSANVAFGGANWVYVHELHAK